MADLKYYDVILKPVMTEESIERNEKKEYTFLVHPDANKTQIKEAVEKMFDSVTVERVNTMNIPGKSKRRSMAQRFGKTAKTKKAIVKLTADSKEIPLLASL